MGFEFRLCALALAVSAFFDSTHSNALSSTAPEWAAPYKPHVTATLGHASLKTDADFEVDKKGLVLGLGLGGSMKFDSLLARARVGILQAKLKGSGSYIQGEQTVQMTTPYLDLAAGYAVTDTFATHLGLQNWFAKGANLASDEDAHKNQAHWYLEVSSKIPRVENLSLALSYTRNFKTAVRQVSILGLGVGYDL